MIHYKRGINVFSKGYCHAKLFLVKSSMSSLCQTTAITGRLSTEKG